MTKQSGGTRIKYPSKKIRTDSEFHELSKRYRKEVLEYSESLKGNPLTFILNNVISGEIEISKSDMKTIVSKNTQDEKFNAFKNLLAKDIKGFIEKASYEGYRNTIEGKHSETMYFLYYSREWNEKAYLCLRVMKHTGKIKPYAIINEKMFDKEKDKIIKENPPQ